MFSWYSHNRPRWIALWVWPNGCANIGQNFAWMWAGSRNMDECFPFHIMLLACQDPPEWKCQGNEKAFDLAEHIIQLGGYGLPFDFCTGILEFLLQIPQYKCNWTWKCKCKFKWHSIWCRSVPTFPKAWQIWRKFPKYANIFKLCTSTHNFAKVCNECYSIQN